MIYSHNPNLLPVTDVIPHRPPRLWLDGVMDCEPGKTATGFWTPSDEQYEGHFPGMPILQGVQQLEAVAQLGGYVAMVENPGELGVLFNHASPQFLSPVFPGDTLHLTVDIIERAKKTFVGVGIVAVNGEVTCEATIAGTIMKKELLERMLQRAKETRT